jgi:hypothetical protein
VVLYTKALYTIHGFPEANFRPQGLVEGVVVRVIFILRYRQWNRDVAVGDLGRVCKEKGIPRLGSKQRVDGNLKFT